MRGANIISIINLRAISFCEAPEKLRKFASFANLGISCALLSVSIQCWFTSNPLHMSCSSAHTRLSPGGACTPNGASTLGLPTNLLTGAGRDAMLAAMAVSLAATACCTSGLRRMMSSRAGTSSSVRFRLVQPRSNSDACPLGRWGFIGGTQKLPH